MDKKNTTIGVVLLLAAFGFIYFSPRATPPAPAPAETTAAANTTAATPLAATPFGSSGANTATALAAQQAPTQATVTTLANEFIEARFTDFGGALAEVALKKYPEKQGSKEPFVFNHLHADPMLALVDFPGLDRNARYERVAQSATEVVYRAVLDNRLEVTRRYTLTAGPAADPYQVRHELTFRNLSDQVSPPMRVALALGTAAPSGKDDPGLQLKSAYSSNGDQHFIPRSDLEASNGIFGLRAHGATPAVNSGGPITWAAVKNQYFTSILTGDEPASGLVTRRVKLAVSAADETPNAYGLTGAAQFEVKAIAGKAETKLTGTLYVGPMEYRRLANGNAFKADQDKIMDFGFFKFFSQILLTLMTWIHGWVNNWGVAIILTTLSLKTIFIPFTLAASKSAKRMAKIQPELQALREKYKDNPQKQQQATMELFKSRKINPVGGCFPILITIPFFMGFFSMLQSTAELRLAPFLWALDLSSTDTIATLFGFLPVNIMPVLMGATMVVQMHLTPSPSVDNAQAKMMKFMPIVFTIFCYTFSCALSLYSFVNGLFTIGQQLIINRMKDDDPAVAAVGPSGKVIKNVTPRKK